MRVLEHHMRGNECLWHLDWRGLLKETETRNSETSLKLRPVSETNEINDLQNSETNAVS